MRYVRRFDLTNRLCSCCSKGMTIAQVAQRAGSGQKHD